MSAPTHLALTFEPTSNLINLVRKFSSDFFADLLGKGDELQRIALTAHELMENAVKFCTGETVSIRVSAAPVASRCLITVRTRNLSDPKNIARVAAAIDRLKGSVDATYTRALSKYNDGLGLARIWAEAGMDLKYEIDEDEIEIRAQTTVKLLSKASG